MCVSVSGLAEVGLAYVEKTSPGSKVSELLRVHRAGGLRVVAVSEVKQRHKHPGGGPGEHLSSLWPLGRRMEAGAPGEEATLEVVGQRLQAGTHGSSQLEPSWTSFKEQTFTFFTQRKVAKFGF